MDLCCVASSKLRLYYPAGDVYKNTKDTLNLCTSMLIRNPGMSSTRRM